MQTADRLETKTQSRRNFLKKASLATGMLILPSGFLRGQNAPSNRINAACVGFGGQGSIDSNGVHNGGATIIGVCDVNAYSRSRAKKRHPNATAFEDYRVMFDKLGKDIDAVVVSTPDHTHFTVAYDAVLRGKHVYVQKPMCHSIDQVRRLSKAAAEHKIISSMGNQGHSSNHIRMVREWFEAGFFGEIDTVDAWTGQFMRAPENYNKPSPKPKDLNWDLWLGPAKYREFFHGVAPGWRPYLEFGSGSLGDMAAHVIDPAYYILQLDAPEKIEIIESSGPTKVAHAEHAKIAFHFPAKGKRGPVKLVWWHGKNFRPSAPEGLNYREFNERKDDDLLPENTKLNLHPSVGGRLSKRHNDGLTLNGSLFYGKKLSFNMGQYGDFFYTAPHEKFAELKQKAPPAKYGRFRGGHYRDWINAIRKNIPAVSDFTYAGPLTEVIIQGIIALRLGRTLNWDAKNGKFINDDAANALLYSPKPRTGFYA
ncbi:MAG: Gfo/Idh/MocA family oxidoreductase [Puniceicoccales bacterium]|jgi:predicted dehydrogenase|nr:Gfo/Idh/MocA family oxidoreductase [Puniceicoccales bacterium]